MHNFSLVVITHKRRLACTPGPKRTAPLRAAGAAERPLIIADAGSTDATLHSAREYFPTATLLQLPNRGFGATANAALRQVATPWALLCNADVAFSENFAAQAAAAIAAAPPSTACLAPQLLNPDGTVQPSVGRFPTLAGIMRDQIRPRVRKYHFPQPTTARPSIGPAAARLLVRCQAFQAVGGFDEKYFLYAEDVDFLCRLRTAGGIVWFDPALQVTHHQPNAVRPPRRNIQRYAARGMLRYFAKFAPVSTLAGYRARGALKPWPFTPRSLRLSRPHPAPHRPLTPPLAPAHALAPWAATATPATITL